MFRTIPRLLGIPFVLVTLIMIAGSSAYLISIFQNTLVDSVEGKLKSEALLISRAFENEEMAFAEPASINDFAARWSQLIDARVTIVAADGIVLGDSEADPQSMDNHANRAEIYRALQDGYGNSIRFSPTLREYTMYSAVPVSSNNQVFGVVRVSRPFQVTQVNLNLIQRTAIILTLSATLAAAILALILAQSLRRPLKRMAETALEIGDGNYNQRLPAPDIEEIGQLSRGVNIMVARLISGLDARESERGKLATVLQEMTDGVIIVDEQGKIQMINPAAENMFGVSSEKVSGGTLAEGLRHHEIVELWQTTRSTNKSHRVTIEIPAKRLFLQGTATSLGPAMAGNVLVIFQNLTQQRNTERIRRDFISNISHELRTPLASLKALTETLQEGALDDPPAARRFLQRMETEIDALSLMVSELLELSRIESGQVPLHKEPVEPHTIIDNAVDRLRLQARRANQNLTVECPKDLPPILADPARLEQVVVNLLHNAIKFTPSGGDIQISASLADATDLIANGVSRRRDIPPRAILIIVRDTGIGIPSEDLSRIFERFFKTDRARSGGGTGLGLAITRHTINAHGGQIWVKSIEGQGSEFFFYIPLAKEGSNPL